MNHPSKHSLRLQTSLERRILHGLASEWENALWLLPPEDRRRFRRPIFRLKDMAARLGSWSGSRNELSLSRSLVMNFPWDDVREVLFHEMAHQFADQVLHADDEPPHGPSFKKACHVLRANPKASATFKPLHEGLQNHAVQEQDRILMRVKKLLSLAESQNRHEAEAAMAKAHLLIKKYNLDLVRQTSRRDYVSVFVGTPSLRHHREVYHLANLLQSYYFVQGLWVSAYVVEKGKMGRVFEISGTVSNVNIAAYVYDFVMNHIDRQWTHYNADKGLNRYRKTDFSVGVIEGFGAKLASRGTSGGRQPDGRELVKVEDSQLKQYMSYKYPHTRSISRSASSQDDTVLRDGYTIGKKLVISTGIVHRSRSDRRLALFPETGK